MCELEGYFPGQINISMQDLRLVSKILSGRTKSCRVLGGLQFQAFLLRKLKYSRIYDSKLQAEAGFVYDKPPATTTVHTENICGLLLTLTIKCAFQHFLHLLPRYFLVLQLYSELIWRYAQKWTANAGFHAKCLLYLLEIKPNIKARRF
jgi:hypothetical protein